MGRLAEFAVILLGSLLCASCAALYNVHDPRTGFITKEEIPKFLKSVKCELITYIVANRANRRSSAPYFDLSEKLFGNVMLDLNVQDTGGLPSSGSSIDLTHVFDPSNSFTWHSGPSLNAQNTYDMILSFLLPQNVTLAFNPEDSLLCYSLSADAVALARGDISGSAQFDRIRVNGTKPLAEWLLDVSAQTWTNIEAARLGETLYPAQMAYTFTVQFNAGLDVKYSLIGGSFNPLAIDAMGSTQQTSKLQFTLNGQDAQLALGASQGSAVIGGGTFVYEEVPSGAANAPGPNAVPGESVRKRYVRRFVPGPRGYLTWPLPLALPRPVH
jgi:hypothetical protein